MALEVGIINDCSAWANAVLAHAVAKYDGNLCEFTAFNPETDETEHVQYVDCRMPVVAEVRLVSITLSSPKTPALAPLFARLKTLVLLVDTEAELSGISQTVMLMSKLDSATTPECMVVVNSALVDTAEQYLNSTLGASPITDHRIFVMPADPASPGQAIQLIYRFISAQREAEIALLIERKTKRRPHFNEAERTIAAHALKDKIVDVAKTMAAERAAGKAQTPL